MVCVLVVEDDVQFNRIICSYLSDLGYSVVGCYGVQEALRELEKMSFDIIVSDIMMKDIDGFEFAEQVKKQDKEIPFLFLTARDDILKTNRLFRIWKSRF
jgi:CheY-like chemotaxis protein